MGLKEILWENDHSNSKSPVEESFVEPRDFDDYEEYWSEK